MGSLCRPGRAGTRSRNQRRQRGRGAVRFLPHLLRGCAWEQRRRREAGPWARVPFGPSFPTSVPTPRHAPRPPPPPASAALAGAYLDPARHAVTRARRHGTAPPRAPPARPPARPPAARSPRLAPGPAGEGCAEAGAGAGERKSAARRPRLIGCPVVGPEAPPLWRGHVIPFKDGRPVVLMNNTWWGEGVRVGVEG